MQLFFEQSLRGQFRQIRRHADAALPELQQLDLFFAGGLAQNQAKWRFLARLPFVLVEPAEIEFHLPLVGSLKLAELQVKGDQPPQLAMVEQEIKAEVFAIDHHALLAGGERKPGAEFDQERLHLAENGRFQVGFRVGVLEAQEVEEVRVAEHEVRG